MLFIYSYIDIFRQSILRAAPTRDVIIVSTFEPTRVCTNEKKIMENRIISADAISLRGTKVILLFFIRYAFRHSMRTGTALLID